MHFADLLSLHLVTFLMFFILVYIVAAIIMFGVNNTTINALTKMGPVVGKRMIYTISPPLQVQQRCECC